MIDPQEQMLALLRAEIGRLVMDKAALTARVQVLEAELKERRTKEVAPAEPIDYSAEARRRGIPV